jgi:hypothetical protein
MQHGLFRYSRTLTCVLRFNPSGGLRPHTLIILVGDFNPTFLLVPTMFHLVPTGVRPDFVWWENHVQLRRNKTLRPLVEMMR